jgi:hypothetical protein
MFSRRAYVAATIACANFSCRRIEPDRRIGTARSYSGGSVRRAQISRLWASLCAPGICWRAGRERSFVPEAGCPGGRHTDALPRGDLCLFGSAAHSPSIHHPVRRRWLPSLGQAGGGARFLSPSVTACCRIRVLLSSARLARGRLAGTPGRCCEDTTPCAAGLFSSIWAFCKRFCAGPYRFLGLAAAAVFCYVAQCS